MNLISMSGNALTLLYDSMSAADCTDQVTYLLLYLRDGYLYQQSKQ